MEFPAYVPAAVRAHISTLIEGDSREPGGWAVSLADAEETLSRVCGSIEKYLRRGEEDYLPSLRIQKAEALAHRDRLAGDVGCLQRLAHDARMHEAFTLMTSQFTEDKQSRNFIYAAWAARVDYSKYRSQLKRAAELKSEIGRAADALAELIRQFSDTGICAPSEFFSIKELLRQTDNNKMQGHNLFMWRSMRRHVLGDLPTREGPADKPVGENGEPMHPIEIEFCAPMGERPEIDPKEEALNSLRYAWGTAPDLPALLSTLANAARSFVPSESGMIGAAIESRQKNTKTEYLRAFRNLLTDVYSFQLTKPIMKAMAVVANVVINLPDVDVDYDDVRKTLARQAEERPENSAEK